MDFRILGPLEVLDEGRGVTLGGTKQRALLALMALERGRTVTTDALVEALWAEQAPGRLRPVGNLLSR